MDTVQLWALIIGLVIVLNTIPAFMPPTWALLAYFHVAHGVPVWELAVVGALAAMTGRCILALLSRRLGIRIMPARWRHNITTLGEYIGTHRSLSLSVLGLFLLGPVPSNHLFIAIGISRVALLPPLVVFAIGRGIGYAVWITAANLAATSLDDVLRPGMGSTASIAAQITGIVILIAVMQVDWSRILHIRNPHPASGDPG